MKDLQLTIYDLFSILLPAALVLTVFHLTPGLFHSDWIDHLNSSLLPTLTDKSNASAVDFPSLAGYTLLFVVTYVLGQVIHTVGKFVEDMPYLKYLLTWNPAHLRFTTRDPKRYTTFFKKGVGVVYHKDVADLILTKLRQNYHISFSPDEDLTDVLIQPLTSSPSLIKRDTFLANACMMRNLAVVSVGFAIYFVIELASKAGGVEGLICSAASFIVFRYGFQKYKSYAERLLLSAFLAVDTHISVPVEVDKKAVS